MNDSSHVPQRSARTLFGAVVACWLVSAGTAEAQWSENFDSYADASQAIGQGGWQGWGGDSTVGGLITTAQALSGPNSVRIFGTALTPGNYSDLVHKFSGYTSGQWIFSARQYIPTGATGSSYFILLNNYADPGGPFNWSIQTTFNLTAGTLVESMGASSTVSILKGRWVELRYEIDLTANIVRAYYNGTLFSTHVWQTGADGLNEIRAVDLYSDVSGPVFYDNLRLAPAPKTIFVNTADNTDFSAGQTNLITAINLLADGDTIKFNLGGPGPHYLTTPAMVTGPGGGGGYPEITRNDVTIDGYSQPGAVPNSNPILAPNNAQIKIVLDGRTGGAHVWDISGYGTSESGQLVVSGNNVTIKGLCFLGIYGQDNDTSPKRYAVALGNRGGNDAHINGCWIGVAPDGTSTYGFADGITGFRHRTPTDVLVDRTVVGVKAGSANPRAEFNVMVDMCIPIIIEGAETRVSGNFIGVLPDGLTRVPNPNVPEFGFGWEGHMELARGLYNTVIGTDGDGVNDADERNLLSGGVHPLLVAYATDATYDCIIEFYGGGTRTNIIIAGNYVGVGINGTTFFTNATRLMNGWGNSAQVQLGSDFDGVSDALEANVIANNHPFSVLYPQLAVAMPVDFTGLDAGERVSVRGNKLINNNLAPFSSADGAGGRSAVYSAYCAPYMDTSSGLPPLATLDPTNSIFPRLKGTFPVGINSYTNIIIDIYQPDAEGWANGMAIAGAAGWVELTDNFSYTNGFSQGSKYLGSFPVANTGSFDVDVTGLDLGSGFVTIAPNYSADPPGTRRGRTHTGNFANPVTVVMPAQLSIRQSGTAITLSWPSSQGLYSIQTNLGLSSAGWSNLSPQPPINRVGNNYEAVIQGGGPRTFYRLAR